MNEISIVKRMNKEDRRQQILEAAMTVFIEKGFKGRTTIEIAKAAEISEVTLFRYFSSKQEIFLEGIEPILFSTLEESINTSSELSVEARLEHILYERIVSISANYKIIRLILAEAPLLNELGSENYMSRILEIIKTMLTNLGTSIPDKEFTLRLLMGSILSFLYMPEMDDQNIKKYVKEIVALAVKEKNR